VAVPELFEAMGGKDFFDDYGGHLNAGGFTLSLDRAKELTERLQLAYQKTAKPRSAREQIAFDAVLSPKDLTWGLYTLVRRLAPFGKENPSPVFMLSNVKLEDVRESGKDLMHTEFVIKAETGESMSGLALFSSPGDLDHFVSGRPVDILGSIEASFTGTGPELRFRLADIRNHE
jgi:single-stranded-DNA-specific exonuclease